ncbi:KaiC domain-containing protein [Halomicrococcus gelatinilyticus]|uniref:KaiC domain-containing protein n=1 Tax=Halomicrococcus gelatinilyticus TaxID=1702103 RepID=UPI002E15B2E0
MTEDDDWFESAFDDEDDAREEADEPANDTETESEADAGDGPDGAALAGGEPAADDRGPAVGDADSTVEASPGQTPEPEDVPGDGDALDDGDAPDDDAGGSLFEEDFGTAFSNAPGGGAGPDIGDDGGQFGGEGQFGGDDEFAGGFDAGGFDAGGSGGFGQDAPGFEDEEFESSLPRVDVGIEGLDGMIQGGIPERTLMVAIGDAGTGKTTFGLQFLQHALETGEKAVYITLEESEERVVGSATEKGWPFDEYVEEDRLAVLDMDPVDMANSLTSIRNELPELVREFGATRLVLDSVSLLEMMYEDRAVRRNEIYDFTRSLKEAGVTTMLTSEASEDNPYASRHGIIEYLTDAVFVLRYVRGTDDFRETRLAIEIQKIRDANHSREIKPYDITNEGISVYQQANLF